LNIVTRSPANSRDPSLGWGYHHTGIPTEQPREGERYLKQFKMYLSGFQDSPYGIEWMRFEEDSPVSELVQTLPVLAENLICPQPECSPGLEETNSVRSSAS